MGKVRFDLIDDFIGGKDDETIEKKAKVLRQAAVATENDPLNILPPVNLVNEIVGGLVRGPITAVTGLFDIATEGVRAGFEAAGAGIDIPPSRLTERFNELLNPLPVVGPRPQTTVGHIAEAASGGGAASLISKAGRQAILREGSRGAAIGAGGGVAASVAPPDLTSQVGSSLGGSLATAFALKQPGRIINRFTGRTSGGVTGQTERLLAKQLEAPEFIDPAVARGEQLNVDVPGLELRLPEAVPSIQGIRRDLVSESPNIRAIDEARLGRSQEALVSRFEAHAPEVVPITQAAKAVAEVQQGKVGALGTQLKRTQDDAEELTQALIAQHGDTPNISAIGEVTIIKLKESKAAARTPAGQSFDDIGFDAPADTLAIKETVEDLVKTATKSTKTFKKGKDKETGEEIITGETLNADEFPVKEIETVRIFDNTEPIEELRGVVKRLKAAITDENVATRPGGELKRRMVIMVERLEKSIDEALELEVPGQSAELATAKQHFRAFKEIYSQGLVGEVLQGGARGEAVRLSGAELYSRLYLASPGKAVEVHRQLAQALGFPRAVKYLQENPGSSQNIKDLAFEFGKADANAIGTQGTIALFIRETAPNGVFASNLATNFIKKPGRQELLNLFPDARAQLSKIQAALQRRTDFEKQTAGLVQSDNAMAIALLKDKPSNIISKLLNSEDPTSAMAQLREATNSNPAAQRAVTSALYDHLRKVGKVRPESSLRKANLGSPGLTELLDNPKSAQVIRAFLGEESFRVLKTLQEASNLLAKSKLPDAPNIIIPTQTDASQLLITFFTRFANKLLFRLTGIVGSPFMSAGFAARVAARTLQGQSKQEVQEFLQALIHSPQMLQTLARIRTMKDAALANKGFKKFMQRTGAPATAAIIQAAERATRPDPALPTVRESEISQDVGRAGRREIQLVR